MSDATPFLVTAAEAAELCRLKPATFRAWVKDGKLPGPLPGSRRWHRGALKDALDRLAGVDVKTGSGDRFEAWRSGRGKRSA